MVISSRRESPRLRHPVNARYIRVPAPRGTMDGARAEPPPIHPRGRLAERSILRYPLIGPTEGPTVRVKGSAHSLCLVDAT